MSEIQDSKGSVIPISEVRRVLGVRATPRCTRPFDEDPQGPCHFDFETKDGEPHSSKDYPDWAMAEEARAHFAMQVE